MLGIENANTVGFQQAGLLHCSVASVPGCLMHLSQKPGGNCKVKTKTKEVVLIQQ